MLSPPHGGGTTSDGGGIDASSDGAESDGDAGRTDAVTEGGMRDGPREASADAPPLGDAGPPVFCGNPNDCAAAETCAADGTCRAGDCLTIPCINQFQCGITASGPACVRADAKACGADRHCLSDQRCIDGSCTAVTELCTDRSQCGAAKACADGRCVTSCTTDGQCAPGFLCRTALGICGAKSKPCARTNDCTDAAEVCVDAACVPRCAAAGASGTGAGAGLCIDNGCVPRAAIASECDGQGTQDRCAAGRICLHHHCYISCAQDAGGCSAQSNAPVCKPVAVAGVSYAVCGTTETLGTECDLTAAKPCSDGKTCVDGFCR